MCSVLVGAQVASGAKRITRRGTFSTSHVPAKRTRRNGWNPDQFDFRPAADRQPGRRRERLVEKVKLVQLFQRASFYSNQDHQQLCVYINYLKIELWYTCVARGE